MLDSGKVLNPVSSFVFDNKYRSKSNLSAISGSGDLTATLAGAILSGQVES